MGTFLDILISCLTYNCYHELYELLIWNDSISQ